MLITPSPDAIVIATANIARDGLARYDATLVSRESGRSPMWSCIEEVLLRLLGCAMAMVVDSKSSVVQTSAGTMVDMIVAFMHNTGGVVSLPSRKSQIILTLEAYKKIIRVFAL